MRDRSNTSSGKSAFNRGADWFASAAAVAAAFYLTPLLVRLSLQPAIDYADHELGFGWDWIITPVWWVGAAVAAFGFSQMAIALTLRLGIAKLSGIIFRN